MAVSEYVIARSVHVLGGGFALGGATLLWLAFRAGAGVPVRLLSWFEAIFWAVLGAMVFTGLGNLVGFGVPVVGARSTALSAKLACVLVVVIVSVVRTLSVVERRRLGRETTASARLGRLYAATVVLLSVVVLLAGVLARG